MASALEKFLSTRERLLGTKAQEQAIKQRSAMDPLRQRQAQLAISGMEQGQAASAGIEAFRQADLQRKSDTAAGRLAFDQSKQGADQAQRGFTNRLATDKLALDRERLQGTQDATAFSQGLNTSKQNLAEDKFGAEQNEAERVRLGTIAAAFADSAQKAETAEKLEDVLMGTFNYYQEQGNQAAIDKVGQMLIDLSQGKEAEVRRAIENGVAQLSEFMPEDEAAKDTRTTLQRNAEAAFPNDPQKQREAIATSINKPLSTTNVKIGGNDDAAKPEPGMRNVRDADGNLVGREVIPGSALDRKNKASLKQNRIASVGRVIKNKNTISDIRNVMSKATGGNTGIFGKALSFFPGTNQYDFSQNIETLMSRLAIDSMLELKAKSPTGSTGFGALSQKELEVMQKEIASLEQAQSPAQFKANAQRVIDSYAKNTALLELGFLEPKTNPEERLEQILDVGLTESDARVIMSSEGMEIPQSVQRNEADILSQYGL